MTLKHCIDNHPMDTDLIFSLAIEVADALDAAFADHVGRELRSDPCDLWMVTA